MSSKKKQFNKIQKFVAESYDQITKSGNVVINSSAQGIKVNDYVVKEDSNNWKVYDKKGNPLSVFHQKRMAIIAAALISKKKHGQLVNVYSIDKQLDIFLQDKEIYKIRVKQYPDKELYMHRLSRVENELNLLEQQIYELEKTCSLQ